VIPAYWYAALPSFLWQVMLHSSILGLIFYAWARSVRLPSGRTKRRLLAILLVLPLVTAAMPGRSGLVFRGRTAWLDSGRLLAVPLIDGFRLYHVVLIVAAMMVITTVWQELVPVLRRLRTSAIEAPDRLTRIARGLPAWEGCEVVLSPSNDVLLATSAWPRHPRLIVSEGALARLTDHEVEAVVAHEHAHWHRGRWMRSHALFLVRLVQCYHPVALWAFREYCVEIEIECDAAATVKRDPKLLARVLLTLYGLTDARDVAAKSTLRKRVDVLLDRRHGVDDDALPAATIAVASLLMVGVLPWVV
jgi:Zn-dependent protease with chaperone function